MNTEHPFKFSAASGWVKATIRTVRSIMKTSFSCKSQYSHICVTSVNFPCIRCAKDHSNYVVVLRRTLSAQCHDNILDYSQEAKVSITVFWVFSPSKVFSDLTTLMLGNLSKEIQLMFILSIAMVKKRQWFIVFMLRFVFNEV